MHTRDIGVFEIYTNYEAESVMRLPSSAHSSSRNIFERLQSVGTWNGAVLLEFSTKVLAALVRADNFSEVAMYSPMSSKR